MRQLKNPILDPRLLVKIEHVAQARRVGEEGREKFLAELKSHDGNASKLSRDVLLARQRIIEGGDKANLWEDDEPTPAHLQLLMWGYTPDEKGVREWAGTISDRIFIMEGVVNVWLPARGPLLEATMAQAVPAVHPVSTTPIAPMSSAKKSWLFKFHGGDWEVKSITSSGMNLTGNGIVLHASKDLAYQINLPSISYFNRLARKMGPPGDLAEFENASTKKARRALGIVDDDDFAMDGYGINDRHPSGEGQAVGQRWKEPKPEWGTRGRVGSMIRRDEGVFPMSTRRMMGLED